MNALSVARATADLPKDDPPRSSSFHSNKSPLNQSLHRTLTPFFIPRNLHHGEC